jgi:hypothetical protein
MRLVWGSWAASFTIDYHWTNRRSGANALVCHQRFRLDKTSRPAVIDRGELGAIGCGISRQFLLSPHRRRMWSAPGSNLSRRWPHADALRSAVVAHAVVDHRPVDDHIALINVGDMHAAEVVDGAVVCKFVAVPVAALVAHADVAEAVIHAAVETDIASPVAAMESITPAHKAPVAWCP